MFQLVLADKIEVSTLEENFSPGDKINLRVSLLDSENSPINAEVSVVIENTGKTVRIEKMVQTNKPVEMDIGENPVEGVWKVTATYQGLAGEVTEGTSFFSITSEELAKFEIEGDKLIITNMGNSEYSKTVNIIIGSSVGTKDIELGVGEKESFRLVAPEGVYTVRITDGTTSLTRGEISLTGRVVGILDDVSADSQSPITGGLKPEENESFYQSVRNKNVVYIFVLALFGAGILLAVENVYKKKMKK